MEGNDLEWLNQISRSELINSKWSWIRTWSLIEEWLIDYKWSEIIKFKWLWSGTWT